LSRRLLSAERAALGETGLATGGLAEDSRAAGAHNDGLGVGEDGGNVEAAGALDIHEEGAGSGHKLLLHRIPASVIKNMSYRKSAPSYLELVLAGLSLRSGVEKVDRENLYEQRS
jgi:hypothetical protein